MLTRRCQHEHDTQGSSHSEDKRCKTSILYTLSPSGLVERLPGAMALRRVYEVALRLSAGERKQMRLGASRERLAIAFSGCSGQVSCSLGGYYSSFAHNEEIHMISLGADASTLMRHKAIHNERNVAYEIKAPGFAEKKEYLHIKGVPYADVSCSLDSFRIIYILKSGHVAGKRGNVACKFRTLS